VGRLFRYMCSELRVVDRSNTAKPLHSAPSQETSARHALLRRLENLISAFHRFMRLALCNMTTGAFLARLSCLPNHAQKIHRNGRPIAHSGSCIKLARAADAPDPCRLGTRMKLLMRGMLAYSVNTSAGINAQLQFWSNLQALLTAASKFAMLFNESSRQNRRPGVRVADLPT